MRSPRKSEAVSIHARHPLIKNSALCSQVFKNLTDDRKEVTCARCLQRLNVDKEEKEEKVEVKYINNPKKRAQKTVLKTLESILTEVKETYEYSNKNIGFSDPITGALLLMQSQLKTNIQRLKTEIGE